jgi:hypothetical protein
MATADTAGMGFATITELPLRLHRVEPDPFIESMPGEHSRPGEIASSDPKGAPVREQTVRADAGRMRGRLPELAA